MMRLFTEAHMAVRTAREQRRADVLDADGARRASAETGQEHTRIMVYGEYAPRGSSISATASRTYPQDQELNWAAVHSYSAGVVKRVARATAIVPCYSTKEREGADACASYLETKRTTWTTPPGQLPAA